MAALEPNHLAAELAEATGVPPDLVRALTRGSSLSALLDTTALVPAPVFGGTQGRSSSMSAGDWPVSRAAAMYGGGGGAAGDVPVSAAAGVGFGTWGAVPGGGGGIAGGGDGEGCMAATAAATGPLGTPSVALGPPPQPEFLDMVRGTD
jgi:hypothetical protein